MEGTYMPKTLPDIIYDRTNITPIIDSPASFYRVPFLKTEDYFQSLDSYTNVVKGCERAVRQNDRYKKYIRYLKKEVKLNRCQVFKDVTDEDASIELHHGPVWTLYDICAIVLEYFLVKKWKITTMRIADQVLEEHQKNRINCVMLSTTVHEEVHARNIFINLDQTWGDIGAFVNKYWDYMPLEYREKLNRYIDRSLLYDSNDFGVLELNKQIYESL
jgi:hypothetical protein